MPRISRPRYFHILCTTSLELSHKLHSLFTHPPCPSPTYYFHQSPAHPAMAALALTMPVEMLHQICENLHQPDLKNFRLVCKQFRFTAEMFLFRHILLRRNPESLMRLRLIADHPEIRNHVKSLCYDPRLCLNSGICEDFEQWNSAVCGDECDHTTYPFIQEYANKAERKKLQAHYRRYCALVHSDEPMQKHEVKTQDLISGFTRLPHLRDICFTFHEERWPPRFRRLSSISQETLICPKSVHGWLNGEKFTALLEAAHVAQIPLNSVQAFGVPWSVFQQSKETSSMMASATKACQHLTIDMDPNDDPGNGSGDGRGSLANMISSSTSLHTLEISLGYMNNCLWDEKNLVATLSEIIDPRIHWPFLERLKLQALAATDVRLKNLLTRHTTTLRSLELVHFRLKPYKLDGKECHGSWIEIIVFLQCSLSLESVRLEGELSNGSDEMWWAYDSGDSDSRYGCRQKGPSLNHRIKTFIVEGGQCPLPFPHAPDRLADWNHLTDNSWYSSAR